MSNEINNKLSALQLKFAFEALLIKLALLKLVLSNCVVAFNLDTLVLFKRLSIFMKVLLFKSLRGKEVTCGCVLLLL